MVKFGLGITLAILLMACGSNAENSVSGNYPIITTSPVEVVMDSEVVPARGITEIKETIIIVKEALETSVVKVIAAAPKKEEAKAVISEKEAVVVTVKKQKVEAIVKASHDIWNILTQLNVTPKGKVNYKGMKAELSQLTLYLSHLNTTPPKADWSENEKLAYWINLYNASTVYLIVSNYPTASITKLNGGKPWDKKFVKSGGKVYSLNQIENQIVRPRFKDPRIHAALNCAAVSCPKMLNAAFLPAKLSAQLDQQCYAWINDRARNEVGPNKLVISQIFDWYKVDFTAGGGIIKFVGKYNRTKIMLNPKATISYKEYNWDLNE